MFKAARKRDQGKALPNGVPLLCSDAALPVAIPPKFLANTLITLVKKQVTLALLFSRNQSFCCGNLRRL